MAWVSAKARKPGRVIERARRRVLVAEPARVREQRHVKVGGDGGCDRIAEAVEHLDHHLPDRGRFGVDDVDIAEPRVGRMVVDVDEGGV